MATDTQNNAGMTDLVSQISDGFLRAMRSMDNSSSVDDQLVKQHMAAGGQTGNENDPLFNTLTKNNEELEKLNESNQKLIEQFYQYADYLKDKYMLGGQSSLASSVERQGSSIGGTSAPEYEAGVQGTLRSAYSTMSNSVSMQTPSVVPVDSSGIYQSVMNAMGDGNRNSVENDQRLLAAEEDRQHKGVVSSTMKKLTQVLDQYLGEGIKVDVSGSETSGGGFGSLIGSVLGALGGGILGFATGYLSKFGEMWGTIGKSFKNVWKGATAWLKDSALGKKMSQLGAKFKGAISGGLKKITELKGAFTNMLAGWKKAFSESMVGKAVGKVADTAKKVGGFFKNMATKVAGKVSKAANVVKNEGVLKAAAKGVTTIASKSPIGVAVKAAKKVMPMAAKVAKRLPLVQAAGGILDTAINTYKVAKEGGNITDIMNTVAAGAIDTLADTLMIPEMINGVKGGIDAFKNGGGLTDVLMGAGKGVLKQRDANDITLGHGLMANIQHFAGNETETSKRIRQAYNAGQGYDAAGLTTVSGAAGGLGHSAALYKPAAPGSMVNNREPNANVVDNMPTSSTTEADRMKAFSDAVKEGVKEAQLSPEVREANAQNAKATGEAINGQLFGG